MMQDEQMNESDHARRVAELKGYKRGLEDAAKYADSVAAPLREGIELYRVHGPSSEEAQVAETIAAAIRGLKG